MNITILQIHTPHIFELICHFKAYIIIKKSTMIDEAGCDKIDSAGIKSHEVVSKMMLE